ncbi:MAG: MaoC family dehydratase [Alphaproteobacteria bacterium]
MSEGTADDLTLDDVEVGMSVAIDWQVTEREIDDFAQLSDDRNPLHMDSHYAVGAGFEGRVAHGFLLGAKLSGLIGMKLPGRRCLLLDQALSFPNPVYAGDRVTIRAEVKELHREMAVLVLKVRAESTHKGSVKTVARGTVTCKILS